MAQKNQKIGKTRKTIQNFGLKEFLKKNRGRENNEH